MLSIKNNILCFMVLDVVVQIQSLVELPAVEDNEIFLTEYTVRNTVNTIFNILQLHRVNYDSRWRQFVTLHNLFASITLQDHNDLKQIARLTRVDYIDNRTEVERSRQFSRAVTSSRFADFMTDHRIPGMQVFITQINEVLNEGNDATDDEYVTKHIETFLTKLEFLKNKYDFKNNATSFGLNTDILNLYNSSYKLPNVKHANHTDDDDDMIFSDIEYWKEPEESGRRIYEGRREKIKRFPFMASVQFFKKFQCGGSIIKSDLVITSASCLQLAWNNRFFRENPAFLSVQVGSDFYEGGDENIAVLEVYFHPEYNPKNLMNNLAIMRLVRALKFGYKVKKVKKIDFDRNAWALPVNTPGITIVGWGARKSSNIMKNPWINRLSYDILDYYPLRDCQDVYSKEFVTYRNFCAGYMSKGGGACDRDVGGPGIAHGILIGVVSFGSPNCGTPDAPTVFTKLGYYADWIEGILEMKPANIRVPPTQRPRKVTYEPFTPPTKKSGYKISPLEGGDPMIIYGLPTETIPIRSGKGLRAKENENFKDFITTMFGSDELQEYLKQYDEVSNQQSDKKRPIEEEAKRGIEGAKRGRERENKVSRSKDRTTTDRAWEEDVQDQPPVDLNPYLYENTPLPDNVPNNPNLVTTIEKYDISESSSHESAYHTTENTPFTPVESTIERNENLHKERDDNMHNNIHDNYEINMNGYVNENMDNLNDNINDNLNDNLKGTLSGILNNNVNSNVNDNLNYNVDNLNNNINGNVNHNSHYNLVNDFNNKMVVNDFNNNMNDNFDDNLADDQEDINNEINENLNDNIATLIRNINIQDLLASDSSEEVHIKKVKPQVDDKRVQVEAERFQDRETSDESDESNESDEGSSRSEYYSESVESSEASEEQIKKEAAGAGLSIPEKPFKDFTFRQNSSSSTSILDVLSQNDILKLLTEAVVEATANRQ